VSSHLAVVVRGPCDQSRGVPWTERNLRNMSKPRSNLENGDTVKASRVVRPKLRLAMLTFVAVALTGVGMATPAQAAPTEVKQSPPSVEAVAPPCVKVWNGSDWRGPYIKVRNDCGYWVRVWVDVAWDFDIGCNSYSPGQERRFGRVGYARGIYTC
jgi:hypothetical protein